MGLLENIADCVVSELESINDKLERLEQRSEYNTDIEMLTAEEAAEKLSMNRSYVYKLMRTGELPHIKAGRKKLIPRRQLIDWIEKKSDCTSKTSRKEVTA